MIISCSENISSPENLQQGTIQFNVSGKYNYLFQSNRISIQLADDNNDFLTIHSTLKTSIKNNNIIIRLLIPKYIATNYEFNESNSLIFSIDNGGESFRANKGSIQIIEWNEHIFKATFYAGLFTLDNQDEKLNITNGIIEVSY